MRNWLCIFSTPFPKILKMQQEDRNLLNCPHRKHKSSYNNIVLWRLRCRRRLIHYVNIVYPTFQSVWGVLLSRLLRYNEMFSGTIWHHITDGMLLIEGCRTPLPDARIHVWIWLIGFTSFMRFWVLFDCWYKITWSV